MEMKKPDYCREWTQFEAGGYYNGDPVVLCRPSSDYPPENIAEAMERAGYYQLGYDRKGALYAFQDSPPITRANGPFGRKHFRVYDKVEGRFTIVTAHGDTPILHRQDPRRTLEAIWEFREEILPYIEEMAEERRKMRYHSTLDSTKR
jgi:hypothetical protein